MHALWYWLLQEWQARGLTFLAMVLRQLEHFAEDVGGRYSLCFSSLAILPAIVTRERLSGWWVRHLQVSLECRLRLLHDCFLWHVAVQPSTGQRSVGAPALKWLLQASQTSPFWAGEGAGAIGAGALEWALHVQESLLLYRDLPLHFCCL